MHRPWTERVFGGPPGKVQRFGERNAVSVSIPLPVVHAFLIEFVVVEITKRLSGEAAILLQIERQVL
jgi:hypothetical protein